MLNYQKQYKPRVLSKEAEIFFFLSTTWSIGSVNETVQTERKFLNPEPFEHNTNLPYWYKSILRGLQNQTKIVFA